jgi:phosphoribosyl-AMP cyclohydrolase
MTPTTGYSDTQIETLVQQAVFDANGLIPAIAQDVTSGQVLMLAWMNAESLRLTLQTGDVTYWSRSRQSLWRKGATSGHLQRLHSLALDCDGDALLLQVNQTGPACHTGAPSCFFKTIAAL